MGGAVSDAAAMGVHWVYDLDLIEQLQRERELAASGSQIKDASQMSDAGLEFMEPPRR